MSTADSVRARRSVRAYKKDPVPREILEEILSTATWSPSAMNTQPWEFTVVTGEVLDNIRQGNLEKLVAFEGARALLPKASYQGVYRQRQIDLAVDIFKLMDIAREDKEKRTAWMQRGFRFFDAPAAIIVSMDKSVEETWAMFDLGVITGAICLLANDAGLGTCIEDQGVAFPEVIRKFTGIPESKEIVIGIAIGYPDPDFPANALRSRRESIAYITDWQGF